MFHQAVELKLLKGTAWEVLFQDGIAKRYEMETVRRREAE